MKGTNIQCTVLILFLTLVYVLLPTNNSSLDAFGYGCSVKYGVELFNPHHLLYNGFLRLIFTTVQTVFPADALKVCKMANAVFAGATLIFLYLLLVKQGVKDAVSLGWVFLAGSCFGFMRYATENETYILPVFLSLAGTYYFKTGKIFLSGALLAFACLFHQVHVLWWLAFSVFVFLSLPWKKIFLFMLPALLVPLVYAIVIASEQKSLDLNSFFLYVFSDYITGSASTGMDLKKTLLLTPVSFVRSFVQVHGNIVHLAKEYPLPVAFSFLLLPASFFINRKITLNRFSPDPFSNALVLAFVFHFLFAAYSAGNAEFMVMLPLLLIVFFAPLLNPTPVKLMFMGLSIYLWNLVTALLPNYFFDYQNGDRLVRHMHTHPESFYILYDYWNIQNQYFYDYGNKHPKGISFREKELCDSCFQQKVINLSASGEVFTDCIRSETTLDRARLMGEAPDQQFWKSFRTIPEDTLTGKWITTVLYQVTPY